MNLSQLYYFRKLAELQHYTRAAKELFITQPTLSGSISSLENELGVSLFQKTGRNVELTKYGAEFLQYVNASLEQLDKGIAIMKGYSGESDGGTIDLGCVITLQTTFLPRLLKGYDKVSDHQNEFNINQAPSQLLLEGLAKGTHDVVFCAKDPSLKDVEYIPVAKQQLVVAMNPSSLLATKEFVTAEDLVGLDLISYRDTVPVGRAIKKLFDSFGVDNVRYAYEDESILGGFAASGEEVSIMLDTFFLRNIDGVTYRPFYANTRLKRPYFHTIYLGYSTKNYRPYCVDHFIDYVKSTCIDIDADDALFLD
jgi:DNA-binding transcriptional LysR family regulator